MKGFSESLSFLYQFLYNLKNVKLIKIDVEGFALNVLKGSKSTIQKHRPALFIEVGQESEASNTDLHQIQEFLVQFSYHCYEKPFNATPTYFFTTDTGFIETLG